MTVYSTLEIILARVNQIYLGIKLRIGSGDNRIFVISLVLVLIFTNLLANAEELKPESKRIEFMQRSTDSELIDNLPLILVPASGNRNLPLVFFISGDGGWISLVQGVSKELTLEGMPVVGLDSQKYFWQKKDPILASQVFSKVIQEYLQRWERKSFILVGYSFGASIIPFITNNLSMQLKEQLEGVYCIPPEEPVTSRYIFLICCLGVQKASMM